MNGKELKVDLSGCISLTQGHIPEILKTAEAMASPKHAWNDAQVREYMERERRDMYVDDFPGLRGQAQINYAAARHALALRAAQRSSKKEESMPSRPEHTPMQVLKALMSVINTDDDGDFFICKEADDILEAARKLIDADTAQKEVLEIEPMVVISTAHASAETRRKCTEGEAFSSDLPRIINHEYGLIMTVPSEMSTLDFSTAPELEAVYEFARAKRCNWVNFDADGLVMKDLPVFDETPSENEKG